MLLIQNFISNFNNKLYTQTYKEKQLHFLKIYSYNNKLLLD